MWCKSICNRCTMEAWKPEDLVSFLTDLQLSSNSKNYIDSHENNS